jgi:hypothetical protein
MNQISQQFEIGFLWFNPSDEFPIQNGLMLYHHCFSTLLENMPS